MCSIYTRTANTLAVVRPLELPFNSRTFVLTLTLPVTGDVSLAFDAILLLLGARLMLAGLAAIYNANWPLQPFNSRTFVLTLTRPVTSGETPSF